MINFGHVKRLGNNVVHSLVRRATSINSPLVWMESIPPDIYDAYTKHLFLIELISLLEGFLKKKKLIGIKESLYDKRQ